MTADRAAAAQLGLRERKKLMTRQAILDTAAEMFAERGYDNVTVVEIADAVNISAKTVFVYFPAKDDLVFHGEDELCERLVGAVRERPEGESPLEAVVGVIRAELTSAGAGSVDELERLRGLVGDSLVLQARMRLMWERFECALAAQLAEEEGLHPYAPRPRVVAAQLVLIYRLLASQEVLDHIRAKPKTRRRAAFAEWLDTSADLVGDGIGEYGRR
ncbi:TetR/AcrR family transcriptional regulator [Crossiella sp. CA198]|uniref:TetR/AcrR family transcriptional regulator n=1 Tax=Crossiella sp. CA198 TaxID=3455607 RepID=UPI003F8D406E